MQKVAILKWFYLGMFPLIPVASEGCWGSLAKILQRFSLLFPHLSAGLYEESLVSGVKPRKPVELGPTFWRWSIVKLVTQKDDLRIPSGKRT